MNLLTYAKSILLCMVTYSPAPLIRIWTFWGAFFFPATVYAFNSVTIFMYTNIKEHFLRMYICFHFCFATLHYIFLFSILTLFPLIEEWDHCVMLEYFFSAYCFQLLLYWVKVDLYQFIKFSPKRLQFCNYLTSLVCKHF